MAGRVECWRSYRGVGMLQDGFAVNVSLLGQNRSHHRQSAKAKLVDLSRKLQVAAFLRSLSSAT